MLRDFRRCSADTKATFLARAETDMTMERIEGVWGHVPFASCDVKVQKEVGRSKTRTVLLSV